ncbi:DNA cytosine methyltransferase [Massilibacteroides vaginae]|uniref:DNA cytosine methyltransferase n=1 Tax=Massilibacteroides vaginae TaxID=1673718 RepID=UPI000BB333CB|nr:DNA cytosine methyltransferase [Massilibacteroides vaginae]
MILSIEEILKSNVDLYYIDLFCGAGGTSTGVELATVNGKRVAKVIVCVNHDINAIASHFANHPHALHFTEDMRTLDLYPVLSIIKKIRFRNPNAKIALWASLECTSFSKAKGGLSRNPDSRTLAEHLYRYIKAIDPDLIQIENVEEFLDYGPVEIVIDKTRDGHEFCPLDKTKRKETEDEKAVRKAKKRKKFQRYIYGPTYRPIKELKGTYYKEWKERIKSYGYEYDHKIMNAADFGAYTSRKRLFIQYAKPGMPIVWPQRTHCKSGSKDLFDSRLKWKPVKDCLDFSDEGESIFGRKKDLEEASLDRVKSGLIKFVAGGKDKWLMKYNSVNKKTRKHNPPSVDDPCPVIGCQDRLGIVQTKFFQQRNTGNPDSKVFGIDQPARTVTSTGGNMELVQTTFLSKQFSGHPDSKNISIEGPAHTITGIDHHAKVTTNFISKYYSGKPDHKNYGVDEPAHTLCTKDGQALISAKSFLSVYYGNGFNTAVDNPAPTVRTKDGLALTSPKFLMNNYSGGGQHADINKPCPAVTTTPKQNLVQCNFIDQQFGQSKPASVNSPLGALTQNPKYAVYQCKKWLMNTSFGNVGNSLDEPAPVVTANRKWHYLMDAQYSRIGRDVDQPCFTLIARMDKTPPYLIEASSEARDIPSFIKIVGDTIIYEIYNTDSPKTKEIKEFMALYGIIDIKMRMLRIPELKMIMGFPKNYVLKGTQTDQKKFIGNAVEVNQARAMCQATAMKLIEFKLIAA